jgi:AcrR family transcriptional regulator
MMGMSTPYELTGRTSQKARTRNALVAAARELLAEGTYPTVEQAADRAEISRTTAYRYFKNLRALLLATYPELEAPSLLGADAPTDPVDRLVAAVEHFTRQTIEHEAEMRAQLRLSLDPASKPEDRPLRTGRAIGWFEDALAPLRDDLTAAEFRRLVLAIRAGCGIEALIWLTDIAGLSREEAVATMSWSARTLVEAAIARPPAPRINPRARRGRA